MVVALQKETAPEIFKRYVLTPIPNSVADIRVDGHSFWGYWYVLKFDINRSDIDLLVASRPFQNVQNVSYERGSLNWELSPTHRAGVALYARPGRTSPPWFTPQLWAAPEAYVLEQKNAQPNLQVLLYNETLGQAYFIVLGD